MPRIRTRRVAIYRYRPLVVQRRRTSGSSDQERDDTPREATRSQSRRMIARGDFECRLIVAAERRSNRTLSLGLGSSSTQSVEFGLPKPRLEHSSVTVVDETLISWADLAVRFHTAAGRDRRPVSTEYRTLRPPRRRTREPNSPYATIYRIGTETITLARW